MVLGQHWLWDGAMKHPVPDSMVANRINSWMKGYCPPYCWWGAAIPTCVLAWKNKNVIFILYYFILFYFICQDFRMGRHHHHELESSSSSSFLKWWWWWFQLVMMMITHLEISTTHSLCSTFPFQRCSVSVHKFTSFWDSSLSSISELFVLGFSESRWTQLFVGSRSKRTAPCSRWTRAAQSRACQDADQSRNWLETYSQICPTWKLFWCSVISTIWILILIFDIDKQKFSSLIRKIWVSIIKKVANNFRLTSSQSHI